MFDFVIAIVIGSVAAAPLASPSDDLLGPLISIGTLGALDIFIAFIALKNAKIRRIVQEEPLIVQRGFLPNGTVAVAARAKMLPADLKWNK